MALQALEPLKPGNAPALLPSANELRQLLELGSVLVKSGLLPQSVRTPEAAATIILKGIELGVPAMAAMENIAVVNGKAVVGSHLLLALVKRTYGPAAMWVSETTADACTISYRIPGLNQTQTFTYRMRDAETAGLAGKPTWKQHPAAMLRARAISAAAKLAFPEVVGGLYVAGELPDTGEIVTEDGEVVIDVSGGPRPEPPAATRGGGGRPRPEPQAAPVAAEPIEVDPETGEIVEPPAAPERPNQNGRRFAGLHKDIAEAAQRNGGPIPSAAVHDIAHDLAAAKYGVASIKDLTDEQLGELRRAVGRMDAASLSGAWDWAKGRLAQLPQMPETTTPDGEPGNDRYSN